MTPCEKLGYKVGDRFELISSEFVTEYVRAGDILVLHSDDGTNSPLFRKEGKGFDGCYVNIYSIKPIRKLDNTLKTGDTTELDGKKYRVTLEEIPQYDFKPGMLCRVIWDGSEICVMHSDCTRVVYLGNKGMGREEIAYTTAGVNTALAIGYVKTSNLRPE